MMNHRRPRFPWPEVIGYLLVLVVILGALVWALWP